MQCPASTLLIEKDILPDRKLQDVWKDIYDTPFRIGIDRASAGFSTSHDGGVVQAVYLLETEKEAENEYDFMEKALFRKTTYMSEWFVPEFLSNLQLKADKYKLACASDISSGSIQCEYWALYGAYLIEINADVHAVQYSDLKTVVLATDELARGCVETKQTILPTITSTLTATRTPGLKTEEVLYKTSTPTITPVRTSTVPVRLTPTIQPTYTHEERKMVLRDLYKNNGGCKLPCWWGFTPGITSWAEASGLLGKLATRIYDSPTVEDISFYEIFIPPDDLGSPIEREYWQLYKLKNGVIESIEIGILNIDHYTLENLLEEYGPPDEIWVRTGRKDEYQTVTDLYLFVFYKGEGIAAWYYDINARVEDNSIVGCPEISGHLMVWNPMQPYTFDEIKNHFTVAPKELSFKPLVEVSGMSIEEYTRHPSCIEAPLDLWPLP